MSIENEIAGLTQSTTDLLEAVNTKKATLDTAVSNAQTAVTDATSQVSLAAAEKVGAQTARDTAESFKDQAYTYSQSAASAVAYQDLTAIAETKSESAVDVFVYDTTKDSDGGAWRQRTQHTSWYNETLNTATRGSRKEFPAVAVIVAESQKVTIYDGDDPSMPMWMVFSGAEMLQSNATYPANAVTALNGNIVKCSEIYGVAIADFIADKGDKYWNATSRRVSNHPISGRDLSGYTESTAVTLVNSYANDVAMTVLPDAPIDPATGLPIPTIAVATDGGVSVIKDDGTVVDSGSTDTVWVALDKNTLYFEFNNSSKYQLISTLVDGFSGYDLAESLATTPIYAHGSVTNRSKALLGSDTLAVGSGATGGVGGLGIYSKTKDTYNYGSLAVLDESYKQAIITSDYNTGWMNGDIKLATLSDTDDTDLVGTELVTNGTFDTDTSGWTAGQNTSLSVENGALRLTSVADGTASANQSFSTVVGKSYVVSVDSIADIGSGGLYLYVGTSSGSANLVNKNIAVIGRYIESFTATKTTTHLRILAGSSQTVGEYKEVDNISVRLAESDRSVNNNGLQVFGTVTREPVATGADLVAYSGLGVSNYLQQPYNPDLDFGTGDFCVMAWVNEISLGNNRYLFDFASETGGGRSYCIFKTNSISTSNGSINTAIPYVANTWTLLGLKRKDGVLSGIVNDKEYVVSSNSKNSFGCVAEDVKLHLSRYTKGEAFEKLALYRISATAPTAEQIEKMYNDEKVLFQEGAQATLYGTSDAVTALAYDDTTELLHVGTSGGRSVFQGLKRVDNTTDAVGTAISASNNLVVEE